MYIPLANSLNISAIRIMCFGICNRYIGLDFNNSASSAAGPNEYPKRLFVNYLSTSEFIYDSEMK
jgi:hypothetical protein